MNLKALNSKKGASGVGVIAGIMLLVVGAAFVYIGMYLNAELTDTINDTITAGTNDQTTFDTVANNVNTAFSLMGVVFIVVGATIVIGVLRTAF